MQSLKTDPGPYEAEVLADSIAEGVRLTTLVVCMPRIVLAEFNTHRMLSRNSASSRAIPVKKRIKMVEENPFVPESFGKNKRGMQADALLEGEAERFARRDWLQAKEAAVSYAKLLADAGVHKQLANRLLEPFAWQTIICTATEWTNFFALRISPNAQPEIRKAAEAMKAAMDASTPEALEPGEWHLPLVADEHVFREEDGCCVRCGVGCLEIASDETCEKISVMDLVKLSVARCARVSYLTHGGERDLEADFALYDKLVGDGHMSPTEHAAKVVETEDVEHYRAWRQGPAFIGNFRAPFVQHRKTIPGEAVYGGE